MNPNSLLIPSTSAVLKKQRVLWLLRALQWTHQTMDETLSGQTLQWYTVRGAIKVSTSLAGATSTGKIISTLQSTLETKLQSTERGNSPPSSRSQRPR